MLYLKINKCLILIVREYLTITKNNVLKYQKVLFDKPSLPAYSSIKSQSLQFRLRRYAKLQNRKDHWCNNEMCILEYYINQNQYDLLFPPEIDDLYYYVGLWYLNNAFYISFYLPKIDVLKKNDQMMNLLNN